MKKIVVGILSQYDFKNDDDLFNAKSIIVNTYPKRLKELGCTIIGLISVDGKVDEDVLELCDAFLFQGGKRIQLGHFKIIDYAIRNNKPLIGVCVGMQALALYGHIRKLLANENKYSYEDVCNKFLDLKKEEYIFFDRLQTADVHGPYVTTENLITNKQNIDKCYHDIKIEISSILHNIYQSEYISVPSLHKFYIREYGDLFNPTSFSADSVIESIEYVDRNYFILGVQYHPELMKDNLLFEKFIEEALKRKNNN